MKSEWCKLGLIAATVVLLVGIFGVSVQSRRPRVRLANGSELVLLAVANATNNVFPAGFIDELIYRLAPAKGLKLGRFQLGPVTPLSADWRQLNGNVSFPNRAVIWIGHAGDSNASTAPYIQGKRWTDLRAAILDEDGEEWEMRSGTQNEWPVSVRGLKSVSAWSFTSFPRRGKDLRFRIYSRGDSNQWNTLADFPFTNPKPGPHPDWAPMNLPASQSSSNLEVTLTRLFNGRKNLPYGLGERNFTRAEFLIKQAGLVTTAWQPDHLEATDATGNEMWIGMAGSDGAVTPAYYEIQNNLLSPSEVWRLRVRFSKLRDSLDTNVWTSTPIEVQAGRLMEAVIATNWGAYQIRLKASHDPFPNTIQFKLTNAPRNVRVSHPEFIDDQGRPVVYASGGFDDSEFDVQWSIPEGAEFIKFSFRLAEMRTVEFLARPESKELTTIPH